MALQLQEPTLELPATKPTWPQQGEWTYDDYLRLPDDDLRYEIIEGVLYVTNAPSYDHQFVSGELFGEFRAFVKKHKLGIVLSAPFEVHLPGIARPVQPDILFITTERQPKAGDKFFEGAPNLVVEVLSPSSFRRDQSIKLDAYERAGVKEYWIANPKTKAITVYALPEGGREYILVGDFSGSEMLQSHVLPDFSLKLTTVFPTTK